MVDRSWVCESIIVLWTCNVDDFEQGCTSCTVRPQYPRGELSIYAAWCILWKPQWIIYWCKKTSYSVPVGVQRRQIWGESSDERLWFECLSRCSKRMESYKGRWNRYVMLSRRVKSVLRKVFHGNQKADWLVFPRTTLSIYIKFYADKNDFDSFTHLR